MILKRSTLWPHKPAMRLWWSQRQNVWLTLTSFSWPSQWIILNFEMNGRTSTMRGGMRWSQDTPCSPRVMPGHFFVGHSEHDYNFLLCLLKMLQQDQQQVCLEHHRRCRWTLNDLCLCRQLHRERVLISTPPRKVPTPMSRLRNAKIVESRWVMRRSPNQKRCMLTQMCPVYILTKTGVVAPQPHGNGSARPVDIRNEENVMGSVEHLLPQLVVDQRRPIWWTRLWCSSIQPLISNVNFRSLSELSTLTASTRNARTMSWKILELRLLKQWRKVLDLSTLRSMRSTDYRLGHSKARRLRMPTTLRSPTSRPSWECFAVAIWRTPTLLTLPSTASPGMARKVWPWWLCRKLMILNPRIRFTWCLTLAATTHATETSGCNSSSVWWAMNLHYKQLKVDSRESEEELVWQARDVWMSAWRPLMVTMCLATSLLLNCQTPKLPSYLVLQHNEHLDWCWTWESTRPTAKPLIESLNWSHWMDSLLCDFIPPMVLWKTLQWLWKRYPMCMRRQTLCPMMGHTMTPTPRTLLNQRVKTSCRCTSTSRRSWQKARRRCFQRAWRTLSGRTALCGALCNASRICRMLPRGCKSFLMEIFCGAATLSCMAAQMGLSISAPIDIEHNAEHNLLDPKFRQKLEQDIETEDPFLLAFAPVCGPWCQWQNYNLQRGEETFLKIMEDRKLWYPALQWVAKMIEKRLEKGREVMLENPWPSMLWRLRCFEKLMEKEPRNALTGEPLSLIRLDQCMYNMMNHSTGFHHQKATGLLLSSACMKERLAVLCDGSHHHEHLEGSNTKKAQQWTPEFCKAILDSAVEEMQSQIMKYAFPAEFEMEEREALESFDGIHRMSDLADPPAKRRRMDLNELDTEEDYEQNVTSPTHDLLHEKERLRKQKWLAIPRDQRVAIRRLHQMMGHCSVQALVRMLKASLVDKKAIEAAHHFRCQTCEEVKSDERPRTVRPTPPLQNIRFNEELAADVLEVIDSKGARHSVLSLVDMSTHYHVAIRVGNGGTPSSQVCAQAINSSWISWAGPPKSFVSDQGVHNRGKVSAMLTAMGTEIRRTGTRAPHQLGVAERHGGMFKEMMMRAIHDRQLHGAEIISALCSECARAKNVLINQAGYSPTQWVLGHTPEDLTSLANQDPENHLGVHQGLVDATEKNPQEDFMLQLLLRQTAKESFLQVDNCQKIRKSLLRRSVPMRGPYHPGDLVCFSKQGKWFGPARVLTTEGKSSLWLVHGGVTILIAETSCRPASAQEILKKHALELRPIRKRKRQMFAADIEDEEHMPFADDGDEARTLRARTNQQAPYVDVQDQLPDEIFTGPDLLSEETSASGVAANPNAQDHSLQPTTSANDEAQMAPPDVDNESNPSIGSLLGAPPGLEDVLPTTSLTSSSTSDLSSLQPELEASPGVTPVPTQTLETPAAGTTTQLTDALRSNPDRLDGMPGRSHYVRDDMRNSRHSENVAFLVSRQEHKVKKKIKKVQRTQKTGAGRELVFEKESLDVQKSLNATRVKEWGNWQRYTDGKWIDFKELAEMKKDQPNLRVIPTRWVDVNKAEPGSDPVYKSRLVVRGDLEDASQMRTDSPTCSMEMMSLTFILAACRDTDISTGDISAAFLQGSKLDRVLVLSMPRGGIPGMPPDRYFVVSSTVYGTKDAPRGWFKNLHGSLISHGFHAIPHEAAAYVLRDNDKLLGLVVVHVDDLLWTGGPEIQDKMKEICALYHFGKLSHNKFKYCGREVVKDEKGVHITCPNLVDRVRPIYLTVEQKQKKDTMIGDVVRGQLRSVVGSLAWLSRVCRPDLSYGVSYLQSNVTKATYEHVKFANNLLKIAKATTDVGIHYPLKAFKFEEGMLVGVQDASFANDSVLSDSGAPLGLRSQSGRLLCFAHRSFQHNHQGHLFLLDWHSTGIRRVCRSTLQAETMSLSLGLEQCEHMRYVLHGLMNDHGRSSEDWQIDALDQCSLNLYTDCRSLHEHVQQAGMSNVSDKRLAIDLSSIRQLIWRRKGELLGDPLLTDKLPQDSTSSLHWVPTLKMPADCLTKSMKPGLLCTVMDGLHIDLTPENLEGCETEVHSWLMFISMCHPSVSIHIHFASTCLVAQAWSAIAATKGCDWARLLLGCQFYNRFIMIHRYIDDHGLVLRNL